MSTFIVGCPFCARYITGGVYLQAVNGEKAKKMTDNIAGRR
jgi:hypothetical protein